MDFNSNLAQVQGLLTKLNNLHPFLKMRYRGDNENGIKEVIKTLSDMLNAKKCIINGSVNNDFKREIREICLFLILNADFSRLNTMGEGELCHLIHMTPLISRYLLIRIFYNVGLSGVLAEVVGFGDGKLAIELIDAVLPHLRFSNCEDLPLKLEEMAIAVYRQMNKELNDDEILASLYDRMSKILGFFLSPPNADAMNEWKKNKLYRYAGEVMLSLLRLVISCLRIFERSDEKQYYEEIEFYRLTQPVKTEIEEKPNIFEYSNKCNIALLDTCKTNLIPISLDIFCCWSEFYYDGNTTWQEEIGSKAYELQKLIEKNETLPDHDLREMLTQIAREPKTLNEIIDSADKETVIKNASLDTEWMAALLKKDYVLADEKCLNCIKENIDKCGESELLPIFEKIINFENLSEIHKEVAVLVIRNTSLESHKHLFSCLDNDTFETETYAQNITEYFNKITTCVETDYHTIDALFAQNPKAFCANSVENAVKSDHHCAVNLNILNHLSKLADNASRLLDAYKRVIRSSYETESEKQSLSKLTHGLSQLKLVDASDLITKALMPSADDIKHRNFTVLSNQLRSLGQIFDVAEHATFVAPTLVMMAQVMEATRWDLVTFNGDAVTALKDALSVQEKLLASFVLSKNETDKEYKWLRSRLRNLKPLNSYYFLALYEKESRDIHEYLFSEDVLKDSKKFTIGLCQMLPLSTTEEWKSIYKPLKLDPATNETDLILSAILLVYMAASQANCDNALNCLQYCCRNAAICLESSISDFQAPVQAIGSFAKILRVIESFDETSRMVNLMTFTPILSKLADVCRDFDRENDTELNFKNIVKIVETESTEESRPMLKKMLNLE